MSYAQQEIAVIYNSLSRDNEAQLSANLAYDPAYTGFRIMTLADGVLPPITTAVSNFTPFTGTSGQALATGLLLPGNPNQNGFYLQNTSNGLAYILLGGSGMPSTNNFNILLTPSGTNTSIFQTSSIRFNGPIYASGTTPLSLICWSY